LKDFGKLYKSANRRHDQTSFQAGNRSKTDAQSFGYVFLRQTTGGPPYCDDLPNPLCQLARIQIHPLSRTSMVELSLWKAKA